MNLQDKFYKLEEVLTKDSNSIKVHSGVPFVLLVYDPGDEYLVNQQKTVLFHKLDDLRIKYIEVPLNKKIFEWLEEKGLLQEAFHLEETKKKELTKQLSAILKSKIVASLAQLSGKDPESIMFLSRAGSLYPFLRVSAILSELENKVKNIVVVFYPGKREGKSLRFLNESEGYYYRAMIID